MLLYLKTELRSVVKRSLTSVRYRHLRSVNLYPGRVSGPAGSSPLEGRRGDSESRVLRTWPSQWRVPVHATVRAAPQHHSVSKNTPQRRLEGTGQRGRGGKSPAGFASHEKCSTEGKSIPRPAALRGSDVPALVLGQSLAEQGHLPPQLLLLLRGLRLAHDLNRHSERVSNQNTTGAG